MDKSIKMNRVMTAITRTMMPVEMPALLPPVVTGLRGWISLRGNPVMSLAMMATKSMAMAVQRPAKMSVHRSMVILAKTQTGWFPLPFVASGKVERDPTHR